MSATVAVTARAQLSKRRDATATTWTYSTTGASSYKPAAGSIEAWAFGNTAKPSLTPAQVRKASS